MPLRRKISSQTGHVSFDFNRRSVAVNHVYFYVQDAEWGPAIIKMGTYLPFPIRVGLDGREWAKRQLLRDGIPFRTLDNGFRWCADAERLQQVCDTLGPPDVRRSSIARSTRLS